LAWCGDIDITGFRRPASYFREIVYGVRAEPFIAVHDPESVQRTQLRGMWAWTDSQASWTWETNGHTTTVVDVYSADDEVELFQDGVSLGRHATGPEHGYTARFEVSYRPGRLEAVAYS
ncbi:DUF4982 domain-containing protein, partial [Pseudomonas sp. BGM005]|nr:DUF4982 domain-containing protein [Pseudomonas sp. BG5]